MYYTEAGLVKLGNVIRKKRKSLGLTLRDFASLCSQGQEERIDHKTIERLETARFRNPSNETLAKIAPRLNLTVAEMLAIASEKPRSEIIQCQTYQDVMPLLEVLPIKEQKVVVIKLSERIKNIEELEQSLKE